MVDNHPLITNMKLLQTHSSDNSSCVPVYACSGWWWLVFHSLLSSKLPACVVMIDLPLMLCECNGYFLCFHIASQRVFAFSLLHPLHAGFLLTSHHGTCCCVIFRFYPIFIGFFWVVIGPYHKPPLIQRHVKQRWFINRGSNIIEQFNTINLSAFHCSLFTINSFPFGNACWWREPGGNSLGSHQEGSWNIASHVRDTQRALDLVHMAVHSKARIGFWHF